MGRYSEPSRFEPLTKSAKASKAPVVTASMTKMANPLSESAASFAPRQPSVTLQNMLQRRVDFLPATSMTFQDELKMSACSNSSPINQKSESKPCHFEHAQSLLSGAGITQESARQTKISKGFPNRGLLCYRNAMIQALLHASPLLLWLQDAHRMCKRAFGCVICSFRDLSISYWTDSDVQRSTVRRLSQFEASLRQSSTFKSVAWVWTCQADANEFYVKLIGAMVEQDASFEPVMHDLFGHRLLSSKKCNKCPAKASSQPPTAPKPEAVENHLSVGLAGGGALIDLLRKDSFAHQEPLPDFVCETCRERGSTSISFRLVQLPKILQICFKRFEHSRRRGMHKINTGVKYETDLDLSSFSCNPKGTRYHLFAVIQHRGNGLRASLSHYRCVAKNLEGYWESLDDMRINRVHVKQALDPEGGWTPYILFYAQVGDSVKQSATAASPQRQTKRRRKE